MRRNDFAHQRLDALNKFSSLSRSARVPWWQNRWWMWNVLKENEKFMIILFLD